MSSFLVFLFQVSVCQTAFYILYHFFFKEHTFFQSNRIYLLFTSLFSFIIPLLNIGVWSSESLENSIIYPLFALSETKIITNPGADAPELDLINQISIIEIILFIIYVIGFSIYIFKLFRGIRKVMALIKSNNAIDKEGYKVIRLKKGPSFFSFLRYVFINDHQLNISHEELEHILTHEKIHIRQRHTIDILFMEVVSAICWFNPFVKIIKQSLRQIHEFIADEKVISNTNGVDNYSRLILRLSTNTIPIPLTHQFSMIHIKNRLIMLNQTKNNTMKKLKFLFALPMALLLMAFFSCTEITLESKTESVAEKLGDPELLIGDISWDGNTMYSDAMLNKILDIKNGDAYSKELIKEKLFYNPTSDDISSLYMDNGYLFFNITPEEEIVGNAVNLNFKIYEGYIVDFDKIIIKGNGKVETPEVLEMINFKRGEPFNRSKLIESQKNIAESGFFKKDEVGINPIPNHEAKTVDIEFELIEL